MYADHIGRTEARSGRVWPPLPRDLAAALDRPAPEALPPLRHWTLFQDWRLPRELGPDGHPRRGGFPPSVHDLPRRMWAGGRVRFHAGSTPRAGDEATRSGTITGVSDTTGASGRLVCVTVRHESGPAGFAITEEQDLLYRGTRGAAAKQATPAPPAPGHASRAEVAPDSVSLFRSSALTGNGHRIHHDLDDASRHEGYPGPVVHGPLQATWLAESVARHRPGRRIASFGLRGRRPAFAGRPMVLEGSEGGDALRLRTLDADGAVGMDAEVGLG